MAITVKELGHLVLYVRDVERSRRFYRDVLGWDEVDAPMQGAALFSSGRTHHELLLLEVGEDAAPLPQGRRARDVPLRTEGRRDATTSSARRSRR